eukprot:9779674-Alexandrium_andersonii.AAC.1
MEYLPSLTPNNKLSELELPNMRNCCRRSELELRGPRNILKANPLSSGGVRSVPLLAQMPNLPTKRAADALEVLLGVVRG